LAGLGSARLPALLVRAVRDSGVSMEESAPEPSRRRYWLVAPLPQWRQAKVRALVAALTAEN